MPRVSPFVERNITEKSLSVHFMARVQNELEYQKEEVAQKLRKNIQIDLNKLFSWSDDIPISAYTMLRNIVMSKRELNPVLASDIAEGKVWIMRLAREEYLHQKKQVKQGKRKHIQVDLNVLYC
jgi:hypothetical protein